MSQLVDAETIYVNATGTEEWLQISPKTEPDWLRWSTYSHPYDTPPVKRLRRTGLTIVRAREAHIGSKRASDRPSVVICTEVGAVTVTKYSLASRPQMKESPWDYVVSNVIISGCGRQRLGALWVYPSKDGRVVVRLSPYRTRRQRKFRIVNDYGRMDLAKK